MSKHTIIWLHGLGASGDDFVSLPDALKLPPEMDMRFVFPNAPMMPVTLNQGYTMRAWFDVYGLSAESKIDVAGILRSCDFINQLVDTEIARGVPSHRILLGGFSQGAAMALVAGLTFKKQLGGVIELSCFLPMEREVFETASAVNRSAPIFLAHGKADSVVVYTLGEMTYEALLKAGYSVSWHAYESMPHTVSDKEILDISQWMKNL